MVFATQLVSNGRFGIIGLFAPFCLFFHISKRSLVRITVLPFQDSDTRL